MRGAAREGDLADAQGSGLVLVELERGDELPRERLQLPPSGLARGRELILGEALRHLLGACERERPLDRLDLARGHVERAGDGDVERPAAPLEHAGELADAAVGDGEGGAVVADRDGDEGAALGGRARGMGRRDRAQQRERLEVDPDDLQAGLAAGEDVAVDELAVGDDEEHAPERLAVLGHALGRAPGSRAPPPRAGSAAPPGRGSGSRSRAASGRRCRSPRRCGRRSGCSRSRAGRRASAACARRRRP